MLEINSKPVKIYVLLVNMVAIFMLIALTLAMVFDKAEWLLVPLIIAFVILVESWGIIRSLRGGDDQ